jgi:hypothetical protein
LTASPTNLSCDCSIDENFCWYFQDRVMKEMVCRPACIGTERLYAAPECGFGFVLLTETLELFSSPA